MGTSKATRRRDAGADTVIGFVLVTGISLLMISVVMLMGAPALEQVQSRQQVDSMVGSFQRLDRGVATLLSGAPAGTTPAWQVSMADGSLSVDQGGDHLWGFVVNRHQQGNDYQFWFGGYADGDDVFTIENGHDESVTNIQLEAVRWEADDDVAGPRTETIGTLNSGSTQQISDLLNWDMAEHATQIKLKDLDNDEGNETVAHAWFIDSGAVEWELTRGGSMKRILYQNTAILADIDGGQVLHNSPRMRASDEEAGKQTVFMRVVKLDGAVAVGGRSTSEILLSSGGNHPRISTGNATQVQIYPPTSMIEAWERHLNENPSFDYEWADSRAAFADDPPEAAAFLGPNDELAATLIETDVTLSRSGGS